MTTTETKKDTITIPEGITLTKYKKLSNIYITDEYITTDDLVEKVEKNMKGEIKSKISVCGGLTIIDMAYDKYTARGYYTFQFFNTFSSEISELTFEASELGSNSMIGAFRNAGLTIFNNNSFAYFINSMILSTNMVKNANKDKDIINVKKAAVKYGYPTTDDGIDPTTFITKKEIVKDLSLVDTDAPLFQKKGTLEDWKHNMQVVSNALKDDFSLKLVISSICAGAVLPLAGTMFDCPIVCIAAPTSAGKGFLSMLGSTVIGAPTKNGQGITRAVDDSIAAFSLIRNRLNNIPVIITDIQKAIDDPKRGLTWFKNELLYKHTEGVYGGRNTNDGKARDNMKWLMPLLFFGEVNAYSDMTAGPAARLIIYDSHLKNGEQFVKNENCKLYYKYTQSAYGTAFPEFTKKIIEYNAKYPTAISDTAIKNSDEVDKVIKQNKRSNSIAILLTTYNLLVEFGIAPASWQKMTTTEFADKFKTDHIHKEPFQAIYDSWASNVIKDPRVPYLSEKYTKEMYDDAISKKQAVLGKKELIDGTMYIYMPIENIQSQFIYYAEKLSLKAPSDVINKLKDYDLLQRYPANDRYVWKKTNITYIYQKGVSSEAVYCIKIKMDDDIQPDLSMGEKDKITRDIYDVANELKNKLK